MKRLWEKVANQNWKSKLLPGLTVGLVLKNFCLVVDVFLSFSSRSDHRPREVYWVFKADVLCEKNSQHGSWGQWAVKSMIGVVCCQASQACLWGRKRVREGKYRPNTTYPNFKEEKKIYPRRAYPNSWTSQRAEVVSPMFDRRTAEHHACMHMCSCSACFV